MSKNFEILDRFFSDSITEAERKRILVEIENDEELKKAFDEMLLKKRLEGAKIRKIVQKSIQAGRKKERNKTILFLIMLALIASIILLFVIQDEWQPIKKQPPKSGDTQIEMIENDSVHSRIIPPINQEEQGSDKLKSLQKNKKNNRKQKTSEKPIAFVEEIYKKSIRENIRGNDQEDKITILINSFFENDQIDSILFYKNDISENDILPYYFLGHAYYQTKQFKKAIETFDKIQSPRFKFETQWFKLLADIQLKKKVTPSVLDEIKAISNNDFHPYQKEATLFLEKRKNSHQ